MKICGASIRTNVIYLVALEKNDENIIQVALKTSYELINPDDTDAVRKFRDDLQKFIHDHQIEVLIIRKRFEKGEYAAAGITFKIEGIAHLLEINNIEILDPKIIYSFKNFLYVPTGLDVNQKKAYETAYTYFLKTQDFTKA